MGAKKNVRPCWTNSHDRKARSGSPFEFLQQGFGVLQVRHVKTFAENIPHNITNLLEGRRLTALKPLRYVISDEHSEIKLQIISTILESL
jgi:hypothetical protein